MTKFLRVLGHVAMLSVVALIATFWAIKILTPPPASAPPPLAAPPPRDPDPVLAARMLGLVQAQAVVISNIQLAGVVAAGPDSAAVLVVDGKPARAYLLGQEVAPGTSLEEVHPDGVTLSGAGGRQEVRIPPRPVASFGGAPPAPAFSRSGNTLSAPSDTASFASRPPPINAVRVPPPPQVAPPPPQPHPQGVVGQPAPPATHQDHLAPPPPHPTATN
jgi:general secretion pathway protein C